MLSSGSSVGVGAIQSINSYSNERLPGASGVGGSGGGVGIGNIDVDYASDPASGGFFHTDYKKHDDLKQMLDSNKDSLKLEAMKRVISMVAKGRDASDLFPAVVKNVVSKNIEVKKLVYVYLVRYAEEQQDLALLSISTFQRALKDPNQLIRAGALRVLSSIRVSMIVPIVMLAIRDSASDMSPYVRKTAAHAIPKLYSLDAEQKDELITVIEKLLSDRTTLVVGSAVMAFEEVCPERVNLIHKNYRKLCNLLVDVDEWGQIIIINMLTRYARTQFSDPNRDDEFDGEHHDDDANKPFYDETSSSESNENDEYDEKESTKKQQQQSKSPKKNITYTLDVDHRLLLRQTKPLLQSRNASVVMTVAQLYHHIAPRNEVSVVAKALIRLLRSHKEVQSVVLTCIASMSTQRKSIFEPYMKSFFVRTSDATHLKLLKLEILTNLATEASISIILREFQTYISSNDKDFVAATIQAIGRCAASIKEVTETCLSGLVHLLSNRDEYVVAESVVVIKKLLQTQAADHFEIISQMAKLLDFIAVPAARASILWLIGEYNEKVPKIAPDVLRKMAKSFIEEENIVKLQVLNLAVKLYLTNPTQTELLCQYIFNLSRYDLNYDIRDRARFLKQFIFPSTGESTILSHNARKIFLAAKPAPMLESKYHGREQYQLGSLSHYLNMRCNGYHDIPDFPETASDSSVRNIEVPVSSSVALNDMDELLLVKSRAGDGSEIKNDEKKSTKKHKGRNNKNITSIGTTNESFYTESDQTSSEYSSSSESTSEDDSQSDEDDDDGVVDANGGGGKDIKSGDNGKIKRNIPMGKKNKFSSNKVSSNDENNTDDEEDGDSGDSSKEEDSSSSEAGDSEDGSSESAGSSSTATSSSEEDDDDDDDEDEEDSTGKTFQKAKQLANQFENGKAATTKLSAKPKEKSNLDLLLDLDDIAPAGPIMTPSLGGFLTPSTTIANNFSGGGGRSGVAGGGSSTSSSNRFDLIGPSYIPLNKKELINKISGNGLSIYYRYTRAPHLYSATMVSIELCLTNHSSAPLETVKLDRKSLPHINEFTPIVQLMPNQPCTVLIGIDFNDSTQSIVFEISAKGFSSQIRCTLKPMIGELIRSISIQSEDIFKDECGKLRGMNEHSTKIQISQSLLDDNNGGGGNKRLIQQRIYECANVANVLSAPSSNCLYFAGQTITSKSLVLISVKIGEGNEISVTVNCEKMVVGSMLLNEIKSALRN